MEWQKEKRPEALASILSKLKELKPATSEVDIVDYSKWASPADEGGVRLPDYIKALIQNPAYERRVKWLVRHYGTDYIEKLAEVAQTKGKPAHYFAKCYSKAKWEAQTLPFLNKMIYKAQQMKEKLSKISTSPKYLAWYIKQEKRLGKAVLDELIEKATSPKVRNADYYLRGSIRRETERLAEVITE